MSQVARKLHTKSPISNSSCSSIESTFSSALTTNCRFTPFQRFAQRILTDSSSTESNMPMPTPTTQPKNSGWNCRRHEGGQPQALTKGSKLPCELNREQRLQHCWQHSDHEHQMRSIGQNYEAELSVSKKSSNQRSSSVAKQPAPEQAQPVKAATPAAATKCSSAKARYLEQQARSRRLVARWILNEGKSSAYDTADDEDVSSDATAEAQESCSTYKDHMKTNISQGLAQQSHSQRYYFKPAQLQQSASSKKQHLIGICQPRCERESAEDVSDASTQGVCCGNASSNKNTVPEAKTIARYEKAVRESEPAESRANTESIKAEKTRQSKPINELAIAEDESDKNGQNRSHKTSTRYAKDIRECEAIENRAKVESIKGKKTKRCRSKSSQTLIEDDTQESEQSRSHKTNTCYKNTVLETEENAICAKAIRVCESVKSKVNMESMKGKKTKRCRSRNKRALAEDGSDAREQSGNHTTSTCYKSTAPQTKSSARHEIVIRECESTECRAKVEFMKGKKTKRCSSISEKAITENERDSSGQNSNHKTSNCHKSTPLKTRSSARQEEEASRECKPGESRVKVESMSEEATSQIERTRTEDATSSREPDSNYKPSAYNNSTVPQSRNSAVRECETAESRTNAVSMPKSEIAIAKDASESKVQGKCYETSTGYKSYAKDYESAERHAHFKPINERGQNRSHKTSKDHKNPVSETKSSASNTKDAEECELPEGRVNLEPMNMEIAKQCKPISERAKDSSNTQSKTSICHKSTVSETKSSNKYERVGKVTERAQTSLEPKLEELKRADIEQAEKQRMKIEAAEIESVAELERVEMEQAVKEGVEMKRAELELTEMERAEIERLEMERVEMEQEEMDLIEKKLTELELVAKKLEEMELIGKLAAIELAGLAESSEQSNTAESDLDELNFDELNLDESELNESAMDESNLDEKDLKELRLGESNLAHSHLDELNLDEKNLNEIKLHKSDLDKINLDLSHLDEVNLKDLNLQELNLDEKNLNELKLHESDLDKMNLNQVDLAEKDLNESNSDKAHLDQLHLNELNLEELELVKKSPHASKAVETMEAALEDDDVESTASSIADSVPFEVVRPRELNIINVDEALLEMPKDYKGYALIWHKDNALMDLPLSADEATIKAKLMGAVLSNRKAQINVWHDMNEYKYEQLENLDRGQPFRYTPTKWFHRRSKVKSAKHSRQLEGEDVSHADYVSLLAERTLKGCCNVFDYELEAAAEVGLPAAVRFEQAAQPMELAAEKRQAAARASLAQAFHERFNRQLQNVQQNLWLSN